MVKTKCEVYSRVVGYMRPVDSWNDSKQAEFYDRKVFNPLGKTQKSEELSVTPIQTNLNTTQKGAKK